jgi:DNA replication protein DnaC
MVLHQLQPGRDVEEIADLERRLFTVDLLVLDDVGAERDQASDYTRRTLLMIYEERGDRALRTLWTSNKTLQQLGDMQDDDRLASRIAGRASVVRLEGADQRLRSVRGVQ